MTNKYKYTCKRCGMIVFETTDGLPWLTVLPNGSKVDYLPLCQASPFREHGGVCDFMKERMGLSAAPL